LKPVGDAEKQTLIRRVTFDLTGLPPTPEEVSSFLADTSPDAYAKRVDAMLASRAFGERWGRHWLDVARYGESTGSSRNVPYNFDPIPTVDYYAMAGIFKSTEILAGVHGRSKAAGKKAYGAPELLYHLEGVPTGGNIPIASAADAPGKIRRLVARAEVIRGEI